MKQKLLIVILFVFYHGNSQQFSLKNLQSDEQIEIALDSAYQWSENSKLKEFTDNYYAIENAIELTENEEFKARFSAYKAAYYYSIHNNHKFGYFLNQAFEYYNKKDNKELLIYLYNLKGIHATNVYYNPYGTIEWNKKAINLLTPGDEKSDKIAVDIYFNLAISNAKIKDWDATFKAATKCINLAQKYSRPRLPRMYYHKGLAQLYKNDIKGALNSFKIAEKTVKEFEQSTGKEVYYKDAFYLYGFSEAYRILGDNTKSTKYINEFNLRLNKGIHLISEKLETNIHKHSEFLMDLEKRKEEEANNKLKKAEFSYNVLLISLTALIMSGLLIFIFQQRKHEKLNIKKNNLLTSKNSELITIKEEVENALKVKTDFLNSITHELRTPLYAINSITHLIKENKERKIDDSQMDILSFSGDQLLRFINDVIDFNLGANNFEFQNLKLENTNLQTLLEKLKKTIKFSLVMDNENNFVFDFDPSISQNLKIDSLKLSRIIINLLNNASKYTQKGEITFIAKELETTAKTSTIEFCIKDTGKGITKAQLNEIKIAFKNNLDLVKRIDNKASGLGMGLVMVNRLLKRYNSELIIESEEGLGTTMSFQIIFNIDTSTCALSEPPLIGSTKAKRHILIVDDNKINLLVTSKVIKKLGHTYNVAAGGKEAITLFKEKNNYDIILMDIMMPEIDGFEATKIIKSINPEQKIIALTAMSTRENKQKFIDFGFENVIEKPFAMEKFKALIE